jgi:peroxiredoxin family protein
MIWEAGHGHDEKVMRDKKVDSLEDLIKIAMRAGVKIVACTMSMDVLGIREEGTDLRSLNWAASEPIWASGGIQRHLFI